MMFRLRNRRHTIYNENWNELSISQVLVLCSPFSMGWGQEGEQAMEPGWKGALIETYEVQTMG